MKQNNVPMLASTQNNVHSQSGANAMKLKLIFSLILCFFLTFFANVVDAQIALRGSSTNGTGSTSATVNKPSGVVEGDVMIVNIVQNETDHDNGSLNAPTSSGWTLVTSGLIRSDGTGNGNNAWYGAVLYKVAGTSEPSSYTFTMDSRADMSIAGIVAFENVDVNNGVDADGTAGGPFDVDPGSLTLSSASTANATAITTVSANAAILMLSQSNNDITYSNWRASTPSTLSEILDVNTSSQDDATIGAAWALRSTAGSTGTGNVTVSASQRNGAILIALKPCTTPAQPGTITVPTNICASSTGNTFSITSVANASSYTWSVSGTGWSITAGQGTTSATITIGTGAGTVSVTANNGACGSSTSRSTASLTPTAIPATPGTITEPTNECASSTGNVYSISSVSGATSYTWSTTGTGWSITGGQGTTSATVTIGSGAGSVSVTANNVCGSSSSRSTGSITPTQIPATPGTISQPSFPCASSTGNAFSISSVSGATTYTWSVTGSGWSVTAGQGTTSATVTIGTGAGSVSVTAGNTCGTSSARTTSSITPLGVPGTPGSITTPANLCGGSTGNTFSISPVSGAASYTWSTTGTGWSITGGQGTTSATITIGSGAGSVSVTSNNGSCGTSASSSTGSLTPEAIPSTPGSIVQPSTRCANSTNNTFSIEEVDGASSYNWGVTGSGWAITGGQGTTSVSVTIGSGSGTITVNAQNVCGTSSSTSSGSITPQSPTVDAGANLSSSCVDVTTSALGGSVGGTATGGVWSDGGIGGTFNPNSTTLNATYTPPTGYSGSVTLTLTTTGGSCGTATDSKSFNITPAGNASISYAQSGFCLSVSTAQAVTRVGTAGGTYSSTPSGLTINASTGAITPSSSTPGTYTVSYAANPAPCPSFTVTTTVQIYALPTVGITGATSGCAPLALTATGASTYVWSGGNSTNTAQNTFNTSGTYTVTGTDENGCTDTHSETISVFESPGITATASSNNICEGSVVSLSGTVSGVSETTIAQQNFDGTNTMTYSASGGSTKTGNSASNDRPASVNFYSSASTGYWVSNGGATLTFGNISNLSNYSSKYISLRLAAFSIGSTSAGMDATDSVTVQISTNGGTTYTNELTVDGNNNAYWGFSSGTGTATATYDGDGLASTFAPSGSGNRTTDGYSTLKINLPDTSSQVRVRVIMRNNSTNEGWVIDDVKLIGIPVSFNWTSIPSGFVSETEDPGNVTPSETTTYTLTATTAQGCTVSDTAQVNVTTKPAATISYTSSTFCNYENSAAVTITGTQGGTFSVVPAGLNMNNTTGEIYPSLSFTGNYVVTYTMAAIGACDAQTATATVGIEAAPTSVSALASPNIICPGGSVSLASNAFSSATINRSILTENFNSATNNWTKTNSSTGGTSANAAWTLRPDNYNYSSATLTTPVTFRSNDNSQFYLSNSDAQGSGGTTHTILESPSFSLANYTTANLSFYQYYVDYDATDSIRMQISTNNGSTWTTLYGFGQSVATGSTQGSAQSFNNQSINLSSYTGNPNVKIRFEYKGVFGYFWALDNVSVTGDSIVRPSFSWTSEPAGYTSSIQNVSGVTPSETTIYTVTAMSANGCAATDTAKVTVLANTEASVSITSSDNNNVICTGDSVTFIATPVNGGSAPTYQWKLNGSNVGTNSNSYTNSSLQNGDAVTVVMTSNATPCLIGSPATSNAISTIVNALTSSTTSITECDSYTWNGITYTTSGVYTFNTTNANDCDSTATLNLTINYSDNSSTNVTECDSYTWNGTTYTTSGTYTFNTSTVLGCDSVATLNLTINYSTTSTATVTECDSYTWNGTTYTTSGVYTFNTTNAVGCDSTATLNLTIKYSTSSSATVTECNSYTWNGTTYTASGTYTFNSTNAAGCDSTATLNLTINNSSSSSVDVTECDSYTWNGTTYTTSGVYTFNTTNDVGCDSTATLNLTINYGSTSSTSVTACDSYEWNGTTYTTSGSYTFNTTTDAGCDSIATLVLTIDQTPTASISGAATVCPQSSTTLTHPILGGIWSSNDESVAVVNPSTGAVTGVSTGSTEIVYTVSNGTCTATLSHAIEVLANTSALINGSAILCAESTNLFNRDTEGGIWGSSDVNVVAVNDTGLVTGIAQGLAYITHQITDAVTGCVARDTFDIQINPRPIAPDTITGIEQLCNYVNTTDTLTYTTDSVAGITEYLWTVPAGITIVSGQGGRTIRVVVDSNLAPSGARIYVNSINEYGCASVPIPKMVYKTTPFIFTLTGTNDACPLMGLNTTATYTCNEQPTVSSYLWEVPSGASIVSGQGSSSIQVSYDTSFRSGMIKVTGLSNCGVRSPKSLNIIRNLPSLPGFVSGPSNACGYYNNGNLAGYKIASVNYATGYIWTLPTNMTLISGQGTDSITVRFEDGFVNATLKVRSINNCFTSQDRSMNISANPYPVPTAVYGPTNACFYLNTSNTALYYTNKVPNAPEYIWTVPAGVEIVSHPGGFGENDTMIEVLFDTSFVTGSRIQVQTTGCNTSAARTLTVNTNGQNAPNAVLGTTGVCSQITDGTAVTYSTTSVANVNGYMWSVPEGATLVSGQGDTSIQVVFDSTFIGGNITVQTSTWCGMSLARNLNVSKLSPVAPRLISGTNSIYNCSPLSNTEYTYGAVGASRADVYNWSVPANMSVTARLDDSTLKVMVDTSFTQGTIAVTCSNACGVSAARTLTISRKLPVLPNSIIGNTNVCNAIGNGNTLTYTTQSVANAASYLWTVPAGATIVSGQGDTSLTIRLDSSFASGSIKVQTVGYCGTNPFQRSLSLTRANVTIPASISGPNSSCAFYNNDSVATYSIAAVNGATGYVWTLPANTRLISGQGTTSITVKFDSGYVSSSIKVKAINDCSSSNDRSLTVGTSSPTAPGTITGSTNACIYINDAFAPYSIRKVAGATGYIWTVPAGAEIVSHPGGNGANDTVIVVNFTTDFVFGTSIQVRSVGCGISSARSLTIRGSVSTTPGTITGPTNACEFEESPNRPDGVIATYTIRKVSSASFYTWEVPSGAEIISHPGGTDENDTIILVKFEDEFNSGQIKVRSHNSCGNSSFRTLSVITRQASTPGTITATQTGVCPNRVYRYSIASMPNYATSIQWTVPDQATILSQSGLTITVAYPSTTIGGAVTVKGINNCSIGSARSLTVRLNACPVSFTGGGTGGTQIKGNVEMEEAQPTRAIKADVYPNPTTSTFRVRLNSSSSSAVFIRLYDMQGRMLIQKNTKANEMHQIGQELRAGSYIMEIIQDDQKINQKLIKF